MTQDSQTREQNGAVLVTGGSGFVGQRLVRSLAETGQTVVSMYHHRLPEPMANVFPVCSDMGSPELLGAPLRGVNTVVHLAWEGGLVGPAEEISWDPSLANRLSRNIQITRNLIRAMEKAGTRRLVFLSALGANRQAKSPFLIEKYLAEFFVLNSAIPEKIVVRPSVIWSADDRNDKFIRSIVRLMRLPGFYPVPELRGTIAPLSRTDVVEVLLNLVRCPLDEANSIVDVIGSEPFRIEDLFKLVAEHYAKGTRLQVKGPIGKSLVPLFERKSAHDAKTPRLRHFLALAGNPAEETSRANPLLEKLPRRFSTFKEMVAAK